MSLICRARQRVMLERVKRASYITLIVGALFFAIPNQNVSAATTTVSIAIQNTASTTSLWTLAGLTPTTSCTYAFGKETGDAYNSITGGTSGSCNTNDWLIGDNSVRVQPNFQNPIISATYKGWVRTASNTYLILPFTWDGTNFSEDDTFDYPTAGYELNFSSQYNTRFTNLVYSTTTSTTTLTTGFYIDSTEATSTQADKNPTIVRYRYSKVPSSDVSGYGISITGAISPTWGNGTTSATFNLAASSTYDFTISFANGGTSLTGVVPFPLAYIYLRITTNDTGGIATSSAPEYYNAIVGQAFQYQPCGITELGGCISNSLIYVFVPSNESLDRFFSLKTDLESRSPFVYVYQVPDYFDSLYNTATSQALSITASTSLGNFTFLSASLIESVPYSDTMRTIIGYLLWVMLALTIYARVTRLFNHQEKTV